MELVPIGEAARMLKVNASALRYYEERGLVKPACRVNGRRMYGRAELRRLAFVHMAQTMGFRLDVIREALDEPAEPTCVSAGNTSTFSTPSSVRAICAITVTRP